MLRCPERMESQLVHGLRDVARGHEGLVEARGGIPPVVGGRAVEADVVELDLADVEYVEFLDHGCARSRKGSNFSAPMRTIGTRVIVSLIVLPKQVRTVVVPVGRSHQRVDMIARPLVALEYD